MSTSLLYHGLGIRGYRYVKTRYENGGIVFVIEQPREKLRCSCCGSSDVHSQGKKTRQWRAGLF